MNNIREELSYMCCLCNQGIESSKVNPAELIIMINYDKERTEQYSQIFFCHIECFRKNLNDDIKMHFHLHNILDES